MTGSANDQAATGRLQLDSSPETLTLVRGALGGMADLLSLDVELLDDLKTAVSEACNNVVMHAYGGGSGAPSGCVLLSEGGNAGLVPRPRPGNPNGGPPRA